MLDPRRGWVIRSTMAFLAIGAPACAAGAQETSVSATATEADPAYRAVVNQYCVGCHNQQSKTAGLELDSIVTQDLSANTKAWEKVVRKLRARQMPPAGRRRPGEADYVAALVSLESSLDSLARTAPDPGRTDTFRRLNRTEYRNAIRDLLDLEVDVAALLPSDSASYGFDNVTVGNLPPSLLEPVFTITAHPCKFPLALYISLTMPAPTG